jgi:hypothetical protein
MCNCKSNCKLYTAAAFIRDDTKFKTSGSNQAVLYIFSCSGHEISAKPVSSLIFGIHLL